MRIRTIKPEFWGHPVMGKRGDATKLMALGLLNIADDEGYFYADTKLIRNAVRPFDDDSRITTVSIRELSEMGYISIKTHPTHGDIGKVISFLSHQVINKSKDSKLKELYEYGSDTVSLPDRDRLEGKGKEGSRERNGGGEEAPPPLDFQKSQPEKFNPNRMAKFDDVMKFGQGQLPPVTQECCEGFFDRMEADGWINNQGHPLADWRARFRTWATAWANNSAGKGNGR